MTSKYIKDLGIVINGEFIIWVSHPLCRTGCYCGDNNIEWAYRTDWPNYNTVYLWHEILHSYFSPQREMQGGTKRRRYFYKGDGLHALIELITDEEMRVKLNGGEYPPFVGHEHLAEYKLKGLSHFKEYVSIKSKDIKSLTAYFGNLKV